MADIKEIYFLTGGGDSDGERAFVEGIVLQAEHYGIVPYAFLKGWWGPLHKRAKRITRDDVDLERLMAGTIIGTSRTNLRKIEGGLEKVANNIKEYNAPLIAAGGDDTLGLLIELYEKYNIPAVGVPQSVDGNLWGYCMGSDRVLQVTMDEIKRLWTTAKSHGRIIVAEVFGRDEGHIALNVGVTSGASAILLPELYPIDFDEVAKAVKGDWLKRAKSAFSEQGYAVVVVSEGAKLDYNSIAKKYGIKIDLSKVTVDDFGHQLYKEIGKGDIVAQIIEKILKNDPEMKEYAPKVEVRNAVFAHQTRGGDSGWYDTKMGLIFGQAAVDLVMEDKFGYAPVGIRDDGTVEIMKLSELRTPSNPKEGIYRAVDLRMIPKYERMGINFGRDPKASIEAYKPVFQEIKHDEILSVGKRV